MSKKPNLKPLPDRYRQESLDEFLTVLDQHPHLAHFRAAVRTGPERQLALFAALKRTVVIGFPAATPPNYDDQADQLLCDILDVIDSHPVLKKHACYYGPDRHLANLQGFGLWRGTQPVEHPSARELFTTSFSALTTGMPTISPPSDGNTSPAPQDFSPGGEVIGSQSDFNAPSANSPSLPQTVDGVLVVSIAPATEMASESSQPCGILHHATAEPGEESTPAVPVGQVPEAWAAPAVSPNSSTTPLRPVRRGQPRKLDDLAKGRLLGLMSYGLSFRQAAAQLGVHHVTVLNTLKRDEEFAQQVSEARLDAISQPLLTVVQASRTNWRAAAWLAKFLEDRRARSYESTREERALLTLRNP